MSRRGGGPILASAPPKEPFLRAKTDVSTELDEQRVADILTPDRRLRVFISSTLQELAPERAAAREAVTALRLTPVMFELGARPHPPQALYRSYLDQSDVFVGIYWRSYGWIGPDSAISGIEDEYLRAAGKPRLLYVKEPAGEREPRLGELLDGVRESGDVSYKSFSSVDELRELVSQDLALLVSERFQLGGRPRPAARAGLPARSTSFVGRQGELAEIERLVGGGARLLTLTGPGGIGKTRLAIEAAERLADGFDDGVAFVPLDGLESADLVPAAIAAALGVRELGADPLAHTLAQLQGRELLLVLDNFEHVTAAVPVLVRLLEGCAGVCALVTSRELLRLAGEHELRVQPLAPEGDGLVLFGERAASARHGFELRDDDVAVVAEICRRLDGVPLAIELAAPRVRLLEPTELLERLEERLGVPGSRNAPERQRTLEAAIAWSYELLDAQERRLLEQLGVFHGSFTLDAVAAVARLDGDSVELLSSLLDKSLVQRAEHPGASRFALLRMIREYALERLRRSGELEPTRRRFAAYYLERAVAAESGLRTPAQRKWKGTLDLEADNFRAALAWALEEDRAGDASVLVRGLWLWFWLHGNLEEVRDWVAHALACDAELEARDRAWLLAIGGCADILRSDFDDGGAELRNAETLFEQVGDRRGIATVKLVLGFGSAPLHGEPAAQAQLVGALALFEELGDLWGIGTTLHAMCRLRTIYDHYEGAGDLFERSLAAVEQVGDELGIHLALNNLAYAELAAGRPAQARVVLGRMLDHMDEAGILFGLDEPLEILALLEHGDGADERAVELLAAADGLRARLHTPLWPPAHARHEQLLETLRERLGDDAYDTAYERGAAIDPGELHGLARRLNRPA